MALRMQPRNCERARAWVSLRLDEEISELEDALLEAHLRRCASCRKFEESVRSMVVVLRSQPLEEIDHPVVVSGRRRLPMRPGAVASAAAALAAVVGVATVLSTQPTKRPPTPAPAPTPAADVRDDQDIKQLRALRVLQLGGRPPRGAGIGSFGAVTNRTDP
jgi:ferric-dicitrate binding protein FerR (iron transport regulator)